MNQYEAPLADFSFLLFDVMSDDDIFLTGEL